MITIRSILVPTDFSESAAAALAYAKRLATQFGSRLHVFHVVPTPQIAWAAENVAFSWPTFLAELETDAREQLKTLMPATDPLADRSDLATTIGVPVTSILEYAKTHDIDLIVMGTHGRGLVSHLLLGSVAERVVRLATMPVLTVHARAIERDARAADSAGDERPAEMVAS